MTDRQQLRRAHILESAKQLLLRNGLRGTTMTGIAKAAGIAKPTLYKSFADKDAVFEAVVDNMLAGMTALVHAAMAGPGTAAERVARALADKHKLIYNMLAGSPHAAELYEAPKNTNSAALDTLDRWMLEAASQAFAQEGYRNPRGLAQLCSACAFGISRHAKHAEEIGPAIRLMVARLTARPE